MGERLVTVHLIETGIRGTPALFDVSLLLDDGDRDLLGKGSRPAWVDAMRRCKKLIVDHVADKRAEQEEEEA